MPFVNGHALPEGFAGMDEDDFLRGSMVSPVFGLDGRADEEFSVVWEWDDFGPAIWRSDCGAYEIAPLDDFEPWAVALFRGGEAVGFNVAGQLWVDPEHRGKGLGAEMVLAASAWLGEPCDVTDLGFSRDGMAAHVSAFRKASKASRAPAP